MNTKMVKYLERHWIHQETELIAMAAGYGVSVEQLEVIQDQVQVLLAEHPGLGMLEFLEIVSQVLVVHCLRQAVVEVV